MDNACRPNKIISVLIKNMGRSDKGEACDDQSRGYSDLATSQGMPAIPKSWKRQEDRFSPRASRENQACQHLAFSLVQSFCRPLTCRT